MTSHTSHRLERTRSATWPPAKMDSPQPTGAAPALTSAFADDLEQHPERHFLSPLTVDEVYGWDSDSDDDEDDDGEWHAGITDFALFSADRTRALQTGQPLDGKWENFVSNQAEAFERALERVKAAEADDEGQDVPGLTPDSSPNLHDDLDADDAEDDRLVVPWLHVPDYLTQEVKPSAAGSDAALFGPDDELPLSLLFPPRRKAIERPGLRHARTLSGKRHVWRRPGMGMFTVGEEVEAEEEAEQGGGRERSVGRE